MSLSQDTTPRKRGVVYAEDTRLSLRIRIYKPADRADGEQGLRALLCNNFFRHATVTIYICLQRPNRPNSPDCPAPVYVNKKKELVDPTCNKLPTRSSRRPDGAGLNFVRDYRKKDET